MIGHPRFSQLHLYVQGEISERRRRRLRRHLESCAKCRATLLDLKRITAEAKFALSDYEPRNLLQRVLERRAAGERVLLPVSELVVQRRPIKRHVFIYAGAAIVMALLAASLGLRELMADRSDLQFDPPNPEPGAEIQVSYLPAGPLDREQQLILRARFRSRHGRMYNRASRQIVVTELTKKRGRFRGTFTLPDSVVYAVFAVQDDAARIVDRNGNALWELLVHVDGKPTHDALAQRQNDLSGRNWEVAFATARHATELYPDDPTAWYRRAAFEFALLAQENQDSLVAAYAERYRQVRASLAAAESLNGDQLSGMLWWARLGAATNPTIADSIEVQYWRARLLAEAPDHPRATSEWFTENIDDLRGQPRQLLQEVERAWVERRLIDEEPVFWALEAALEINDPNAVIRWASRARTLEFQHRLLAAESLTLADHTRHIGISELRYELQQLSSDANRDLAETESEFDTRTAERRSALLARLGTALVAANQVSAARDTLVLATQFGWNLETFWKIAKATLSMRDTVTALKMYANIAVDPGTPERQLDSIRSVVGRLTTPEHWQTLTASAFDDMRNRTMQSAIRRPLPNRVRLADGAADAYQLREIIDGEITLVAFWSAACAPALEQLRRLEEVASALQAEGAQVITILPGQQTQTTDRIADEPRPSTPTYYDSWGEGVRAFSSWGTPDYYVVDRSGVIRFAPSGLAEVARQVATLQAGYGVADNGSN